jgi:hypothetical protein
MTTTGLARRKKRPGRLFKRKVQGRPPENIAKYAASPGITLQGTIPIIIVLFSVLAPIVPDLTADF